MKKIVNRALLPLILISLFFFVGCPEPGTDTLEDNSAALINSVWMGTTPQGNGTGWLTITFKAEGKVIWAFNFDNTTNEWDYTFNTANEGTITVPGGWNPCPNGFTVSGDTLTVTNFGSHEGTARKFKQVRKADLTVTEPVPFTPETLTDNLIGSVWGGSTPASNGTSWLTISFRTKRTTEGLYEAAMTGDNVAVLSYAHDNTTAVWEYSYTSSDKTGTAFTNGHKPDGTDTTWNPGAYTISNDGLTMTFSNFGGHAGEKTFKRYR